MPPFEKPEQSNAESLNPPPSANPPENVLVAVDEAARKYGAEIGPENTDALVLFMVSAPPNVEVPVTERLPPMVRFPVNEPIDPSNVESVIVTLRMLVPSIVALVMATL